jgi:uncharacterized protein DUF6084
MADGAATAATALAVPDLRFAVEGVAPVRFSAGPALRFGVRVDELTGTPVQSLNLNVQIRIDATRRAYDAATQERLFEVFGPPELWSRSLRTLSWAQATVVVPAFEHTTLVEIDVPCSYDVAVASAKYLAALGDDGDVPLELLFSGTAFHGAAGAGMRIAHIPWDRETHVRMPVRVWREALDIHFPGAAWVRVNRDAFDRLSLFRARRALTSWDEVIEALLAEADGG